MIQRILPPHTRIVRHGAHHHLVAAWPEPTVRFGRFLIGGLTQQRRQTLAVLASAARAGNLLQCLFIQPISPLESTLHTSENALRAGYSPPIANCLNNLVE